MEAFTTFLAGVWELFQSVTVPILNITFAQMWLGVFVVGISISILRPLLGIGFGAVNNLISAGKRGYDGAYSRAKARQREDYNSSYAKYKADRNRAKDYAERYKRGE